MAFSLLVLSQECSCRVLRDAMWRRQAWHMGEGVGWREESNNWHHRRRARTCLPGLYE